MFLPRLGRVVIQDFARLKVDSQAKNIAAWTPVVAETLDGFVKFDDKAVSTRSLARMLSLHETHTLRSSRVIYQSFIHSQRSYFHETWRLKFDKALKNTLQESGTCKGSLSDNDTTLRVAGSRYLFILHSLYIMV